jgi:hypothetical protein
VTPTALRARGGTNHTSPMPPKPRAPKGALTELINAGLMEDGELVRYKVGELVPLQVITPPFFF